MKPEKDDLDLRNAFGPVPEDVEKLVLQTASSVPSAPPQRRRHARTLVIVLALMLSVLLLAAAAASRTGWREFFQDFRYISMPNGVEAAMNVSKPLRFEVGPLTFTVNQLISDGKIAMASTQVTATDGSMVLCTGDAGPQDNRLGSNKSGRQMAARLNLAPETDWLTAAKATGMPLYEVRAILEPTSVYSLEEMEDWLWDDKNNLAYFSMLYLTSTEGMTELPVSFLLRVAAIDPETGEVIEKWTDRPNVTIPISPKAEERVYVPAKETYINGYRLESVRAERYVTGVYLYTTLTAPDGIAKDSVSEANLYDLITFCQSDGTRYDDGISLTGAMNIDTLPTVIIESMISVNTLPKSLYLPLGDELVELK